MCTLVTRPRHKIIYLNAINPMEMHDSGVVKDNAGLIVRGHELDEDFNRRILPRIHEQQGDQRKEGLNLKCKG